MRYITCTKNGRSCKTTNRKTRILPNTSRQMYKRKVQTLSGASFESTTCSKLKKHIPSYIVQEKHFQEYKNNNKKTKQIQLRRTNEREQQNQINLA